MGLHPNLPASPSSSSDVEEVPPDGGWGWLVLGGTVVISMLIPGTIKSFGVFFVEFMDLFDATPVVASWIPALCYFLYCSLGPLSSYLCLKTSYRTVTFAGGIFASTGLIVSYFANSIEFLYISYGVLVGIGAGLSYPPGIYIVTSYFVKLRGLANGIAVSGSAIGSIILPPFLRYLLEAYGYRGATLIMGGLCLNVLAAAMLYEPVEKHMKKVKIERKEEKEEEKEEERVDTKRVDVEGEKLMLGEGEKVVGEGRRWSDAVVGGPWHGSTLLVERKQAAPASTSFLHLLKEPLFLVLLCSNASSFIGYVNFTILLPAYALELGYDKDMAARLLSVVASLDLVGRIGGAALSDFLSLDKSVYFFGGLLVSGVTLGLLPYAGSYLWVAVLCALFGLASGTAIGIIPVVMAHFLGDHRLVASYGLCLFFGGILQLIGPPLCGFVFQYIHRYSPIITSLGFTLIFGSSGCLIVPFLKKNKSQVYI